MIYFLYSSSFALFAGKKLFMSNPEPNKMIFSVVKASRP
jgi:hypothetical protein